MNDEYHLGDG